MENRLKTLLLTLLTTLSASLSAAPVGYSVNSDSPSDDYSDGLYTIDLATGNMIARIGTVQTTPFLESRIDVEGLAFAPDGTLYGVDDDALKLFAIQVDKFALVDPDKDYDISKLTNGNNDFGMTFACDEQLYITSVTDQSLYRLDLEGNAELVGGPQKGGLGQNISALAAYGFPVELYGLGNGTVGENATSTPTLYRIDSVTGTATEIGPLSGDFDPYAEAGLAFDEAGNLWAITDRRPQEQASQVFQINKETGATTPKANVTADDADAAKGFESLAITGPGGCTSSGNGQIARFWVQKRFTDGNDVAPVTLNFRCDGGTVFNGTRTIFPGDFSYGVRAASFLVDNVPQAPISCEVWETVPPGYTAEYSCQSETSCTTGGEVSHCVFSEVVAGQENVCLIDNNVAPVEIDVTKEWNYITQGQAEEAQEFAIEEKARIVLTCSRVQDGDGEGSRKKMEWAWRFKGNPATRTATVYPRYDGKTACWVEETVVQSAVESENSCDDPFEVNVGDQDLQCLVTNTIFFEGIPTLNRYGLLLIIAVMLLTGTLATRRFG